MKVWVHFLALTALAALVLASLAFAGVRFAAKPVRWMPGALTVYFVVALIGILWALWPLLANSRMMNWPLYVRLPIHLLVVLIVFSIFAYLSYCGLFNLWFAFGGQL